jgi:fructokinase
MKATNNQPLVLGIGEVLWDLLPAGRQFGGAPVNFVYHAAQCGAIAYAVSAVGDDALGGEILRRMDALGIGRQHVAIVPTHPTGTVTVALDDAGKPHYSIREDVAWDYIPATPSLLELAARADAVCFGTLAQRSPVSRRTIRDVLAVVPERCLRVFDINLRLDYYGTAVLNESLRNCDVLKLNDEELPILARLAGVDGNEFQVFRSLLERYDLVMVALTKGTGGAVLVQRDRCSIHRGVPTTVVDTVGAGDAFTAAITIGLLRSADLDAINDFANRLASYVCSQNGAMPPTGLLRADPSHDGLNRSFDGFFQEADSLSELSPRKRHV